MSLGDAATAPENGGTATGHLGLNNPSASAVDDETVAHVQEVLSSEVRATLGNLLRSAYNLLTYSS